MQYTFANASGGPARLLTNEHARGLLWSTAQFGGLYLLTLWVEHWSTSGIVLSVQSSFVKSFSL